MRKAVLCLLAAAMFFGNLVIPARAAEISAQAAILWNADTGDVLYEREADTPLAIASVTKLLTALVTAEACDMAETVTVAPEAAGVEGSSLYLAAGEELTVETLLYGLLLESGNDAAAALAYHVSGGIDAFAEEMNLQAQALGCTNSSFKNPHGLTQEGHYSTARDLARIMAAVMEVPCLREIMATGYITCGDRTFENHNRLLQLYEHTTGGKTGYTQAAGRTLVTSAEKDGVHLICVTLNDGDDWNDHISLYEEGFSRYRRVEVLAEGETWQVPVISGVKPYAEVGAEPFSVSVLQEDTVEIAVSLPKFVYAGVECGSTAGFLSVYVNGEERERVWLSYTQNIARDEEILEYEPGEFFLRLKQIIWGIFPLER